MAFKEVNATAISLTMEIGKSMTGFYMGSRMVKGNYGDQTIWEFSDEDGIGFSVYGFTALDRKMAIIPKGSLVRITYRGKEAMKIKGKMKDVHTVSVMVDDEHKLASVPETNGHKVPVGDAIFDDEVIVEE